MTITAAEAKRQRQQLRREIERDLKRKDRDKLRTLRENIRGAKRHKRERMKEIVQMCRDARATNRERAKAIRAAARLEAGQRIERLRSEARCACNDAKAEARKKGNTAIDKAAGQLAAERNYQRTMRLYGTAAKPLVSTRPGGKKPTAAERRSESDSEVELNLPDDLIPVFRKVKDRIKPTARRTRTEAFLEWAQENSGEVYRITDEAIEADIEQLIREEAQLARDIKRERRYARLSDDDLGARYQEAAPF